MLSRSRCCPQCAHPRRAPNTLEALGYHPTGRTRTSVPQLWKLGVVQQRFDTSGDCCSPEDHRPKTPVIFDELNDKAHSNLIGLPLLSCSYRPPAQGALWGCIVREGHLWECNRCSYRGGDPPDYSLAFASPCNGATSSSLKNVNVLVLFF